MRWLVKRSRRAEQASTLASELYGEPQAYAKIIEANLLMAAGRRGPAIQVLTEANKLLDTWIGRFDLGRAYFEAKAYLEADAEFDRCLKRRGEAMALFLDEVPTYGYFPPVHYYQGRVRQEMGIPTASDSFKTFVSIRAAAGEDPLLDDARRRAQSSDSDFRLARSLPRSDRTAEGGQAFRIACPEYYRLRRDDFGSRSLPARKLRDDKYLVVLVLLS